MTATEIFKPQVQDAGRLVYNACQESRTSPTINEQKCADLQDQYHYEFLCKNNNTNPSTECWVESK